MATQFKRLGANDIRTTRTLLHEAIPVTGSLVSGTYTDAAHTSLQKNIRDYSHGMFQSVYDYPYLSSSANHLFDVTFGYSANSRFSASTNVTQQEKKINVYNQMAQVLVGHDETGSIKEFEHPSGTKIKEAFFLNMSRLLTKDEIKKGSFVVKFGKGHNTSSFRTVGGASTPASYTPYDLETVQRKPSTGAQTDLFYTDSPAGEYSVLSGTTTPEAGLLYYQAGIAVLTASLLMFGSGSGDDPQGDGSGKSYFLSGSQAAAVGGSKVEDCLTGSTIKRAGQDFRHRLYSLDFNNTTELNSTIYYCRINHNEFNYSANPTYLTGSKIRVKTSTLDQPVSYITSVGLYSADNELLAVAKLSEPIKKTPETDLTLRVRLDY